MNKTNKNHQPHRDVIQRYCPKRGENVIMLRTNGEKRNLQCCGYDCCEFEKSDYCGGITSENQS